MAEAESRKRGTAAELLSQWRAAERDLVAARESADVATLAAAAAQEALVAARETGDAARLSADAARRAEQSALRTAEAAQATARAAENEKQVSSEALERSAQAEQVAGDRYRNAGRQGFPKSERPDEPRKSGS